MSIAEVAKRAGVSNATISRVINHHRGVSEATAASVRRAMEEVGYTPSPNRPGPKPGSRKASRTTNVLFLVTLGESSQASTGFQRLVEGVSSALEEQSANLTIKFVSGPEEARALNMTQPRVDGVLAHGGGQLDGFGDLLADLPTVWLMSNPVRPTWGDQVMPDNDEIGRLAAQHLTDLGRDRLAYLNLLPGHWALQLHARAFLDSASRMGVDAEVVELPRAISDRYCINFEPQEYARLAEAADRLVDELLCVHPKVNGVFVAEDAQAALLVPALQRRGLDTGPDGDMSVISCNDERPYLMGLNPCPATIDIRVEAIGRRGASQLLWRIAEGSTADRMCTTVEPSLVLPESPATSYTTPRGGHGM